MKTSELIILLVKAMRKYGDLPITLDNYSEGLSSEEIHLNHQLKYTNSSVRNGDVEIPEHMYLIEYPDGNREVK